jgi:hypothetical protein
VVKLNINRAKCYTLAPNISCPFCISAFCNIHSLSALNTQHLITNYSISEGTRRKPYMQFHTRNYPLQYCSFPLSLVPRRPKLSSLFSFRIILKFESYRESVGLLGRGISPTQGRYLYGTTQTQDKSQQISVPRVEFEPMIPVFQRTKAFHTLNRVANVCSCLFIYGSDIMLGNICPSKICREENKTVIMDLRFSQR